MKTSAVCVITATLTMKIARANMPVVIVRQIYLMPAPPSFGRGVVCMLLVFTVFNDKVT